MFDTPLFVALAGLLAWLSNFIPRAVMQGVPLMLGSTGETLTEKSGNLNLGIPGIMYVGGICGVIGSYLYDKSLTERATGVVSYILDASGGKLRPVLRRDAIDFVYGQMQSDFLSIAIPVVCCLLGALLMGLIYSFLTVTLRANQNVTGLALTTFGTGIGNFFGGSIAKLAGGSSANIELAKMSKVFKRPLFTPEAMPWFTERGRFWCLIAAAACFLVLLGLMILSAKCRPAAQADPAQKQSLAIRILNRIIAGLNGSRRLLRRLLIASGVLTALFAILYSPCFDEHSRVIAFIITALGSVGLGIGWIVVRIVRKRVPEWLRWLTIAFGTMLVALMGINYGFMVYVSVAIALAASWVLTHTRRGLHLRAVGENPATADAAGISVARYKYVATCVGAMIAGLGGLYFVMDYVSGVWSNDAFGDRGWLAIALVIFTVWRPNVGVVASILFGGLYILDMYIPTGEDQLHLKELYKMIPYAVTLIVLIVTSILDSRDKQPPAHLGLPYFREDR